MDWTHIQEILISEFPDGKESFLASTLIDAEPIDCPANEICFRVTIGIYCDDAQGNRDYDLLAPLYHYRAQLIFRPLLEEMLGADDISIRWEPLPKQQDKQFTESPIEEKLFRAAAHLPLVPQYQIGKYRVDFAIPSRMLAIECVGYEWHHGKKKMIADKQRERYLIQHGWKVLSFMGTEICRNVEKCVKHIEAML